MSMAKGMIMLSSCCSPWRRKSFDSMRACAAIIRPVGADRGSGEKVPGEKAGEFLALKVLAPQFFAGELEEDLLEITVVGLQPTDQHTLLCDGRGDRRQQRRGR